MSGVACGRRCGVWARFGVLGRVVVLVVSLALLPAPAHAELAAGAGADERGFWEEVGLNAGTGFVNIAYIPAKILYGVAGGLVGGLAYLVTLGSTETANAIWEPTLGGTYVLTPKMLTGEEKLHFNGPPYVPPTSAGGTPDYPSQWSP